MPREHKYKNVAVVYPNQLFKDHPALKICDLFILVEDPLFFRQYPFHKQKLVFHRASMKAYAAYLQQREKEVVYLDSEQIKKSIDLINFIPSSANGIYCVEVDDNNLSKALKELKKIFQIKSAEAEFKILNSPSFFSTLSEARELCGNKNRFFMASFYQAQRRKHNILMEGGSPRGGKWSFDSENRKRLPKGQETPKLLKINRNSFVLEAVRYVEKSFSNNPGSLNHFIYPTTFNEASDWLEDFLLNRFKHYGDYQDAIVSDQAFLYHSLLSPLLNSGILTPAEVLKKAVSFAEDKQLPLNTLEGLVRQLLGWREYVRLVYHELGSRQRTRNFWGHTKQMPASFWSAETGIVPLDAAIRHVIDFGYCHHIERLMVIGNFMLLCEFDPDQVYEWFMTLFIDAYDWVMVPNVYGMSQFADGGLIVTKPYISSSNYIRKMSDFPAGEWTELWDALYWRFIAKHRSFFEANARLKMMTIHLDRMKGEKLNDKLELADSYLAML